MSWNVLYSPPPVTVAVVPLAGLLSLTGHPPTVVNSGGSTLGVFAAGMTSGTWSSQNPFTMTGLNAGLISPGGGTVLEYSTNGHWDPIHKEIRFYGQLHGTGSTAYTGYTLRYQDSSNTWDNSSLGIPYTGSAGDPAHNFGGSGMDFTTGELYWHHSYGTRLHFLPYGTSSWSEATNQDPAGGHAQLSSCVFNPFMGSAGKIVSGSYYGLSSYEVATDTWVNLWAGFNTVGITMSSSPTYCQGFYDVAAQATFHGGGYAALLTKVSAAGVVSQVGNTPDTVGIPGAGTNSGVFVDGYTTPGGTVRKPMIIHPGGGMWEYTSGSDTWASLGVTAPNTPDTSDNSMCYVAISTYDCVLFLTGADASGTPAFWIYKR